MSTPCLPGPCSTSRSSAVMQRRFCGGSAQGRTVVCFAESATNPRTLTRSITLAPETRHGRGQDDLHWLLQPTSYPEDDELDLPYSLSAAVLPHHQDLVLHPLSHADQPAVTAEPSPAELQGSSSTPDRQGSARRRQQRSHRAWQSQGTARTLRTNAPSAEAQSHVQGQPQHHNSLNVHPMYLTGLLRECKTLAQLQQQCNRYMPVFNHVHVACAMNRLVKCREATQPQNQAEVHELMHVLETFFVHHIHKHGAREVANAIWGWAKLSYVPQASTRELLINTILADDGALLRRPDCTAQALANLAWGMAKLEWQEQAVWDHTAAAVQRVVDRYQREAAANSTQADAGRTVARDRAADSTRASAGRTHRRHSAGAGGWGAAGKDGHKRAEILSRVDMVTLAYSFAQARQHQYPVMRTLLKLAEAEVKHFMPQDLSNILWACAYSRMLPRSLFEAAAPAVAASVSGFTTQGLTNTAWAYAVAGVHSPTVFGAIAREANKRPIGVFEPRHLAQLLWSMVKAKQVHPPMVRKVIKAAVSEPDQWQIHNLARIVYCLAAGHMAWTLAGEMAQLTPVLTASLKQAGLPSHSTANAASHSQDSHSPVNFQDVSQVVWAHATGELYDAELFSVVEQLCMADPDGWTQSLRAMQTILWSLGLSGHYNEDMCNVACAKLRGVRYDSAVTEPALAQIAGCMVALAQFQHRDDAACAAVAALFAAACKRSPALVTNTTLVTVLWAFVVLGYKSESLLRAAFALLRKRWAVQEQCMTECDEPVRVPYRARLWLTAAESAAAAQSASDTSSADAGVSASMSDGLGLHGADAVGLGLDGAGYGEGDLGAMLLMGPRSGADPDMLYGKQFGQLFQLGLWLQDVDGESGRALLDELMPPSLQQAARSVWVTEAKRDVTVSHFQEQVIKALKALGLNIYIEQLTDDRLFCMDVVTVINGHRVCIEANGPGHYRRTEPRHVLGNKALRDTLVRKRGYKVVNVPYWEWEALPGEPTAGAEYLRGLILSELGPGVGAHLPLP